MNNKGNLFVFEGPDGNGKTTIVNSVYNLLVDKTILVSKFSFPGKLENTLGKIVYDLHHEPQIYGISNISPGSLQTLHVAAHIESIQNSLLPSLEKGETVLLDRFWWSSLVYGMNAGLSKKSLSRLMAWENCFWNGYVPSSIFLIKRKEQPLRLEMELEKWETLQKEYETIAGSEQQTRDVHQLYNDSTLNEITETIVKKILIKIKEE